MRLRRCLQRSVEIGTGNPRDEAPRASGVRWYETGDGKPSPHD